MPITSQTTIFFDEAVLPSIAGRDINEFARAKVGFTIITFVHVNNILLGETGKNIAANSMADFVAALIMSTA